MLHKNYFNQIIFKELYFIKYYYKQTETLHIIIYEGFIMYNNILIKNNCSPAIFISRPRILKSWCRIFNCWGGN